MIISILVSFYLSFTIWNSTAVQAVFFSSTFFHGVYLRGWSFVGKIFVVNFTDQKFNPVLNMRTFLEFIYIFGSTLLQRRFLLYRNQSIELQSKSIDWFLYERGLRNERVTSSTTTRGIPTILYVPLVSLGLVRNIIKIIYKKGNKQKFSEFHYATCFF